MLPLFIFLISDLTHNFLGPLSLDPNRTTLATARGKEEMDKPCGCPPGVCDHGTGDRRDPWYSTVGLLPPVQAMSQRNLNAKTEQGP
ncbi:T0163969 isoform 7, partial [Pan troglodytes]